MSENNFSLTALANRLKLAIGRGRVTLTQKNDQGPIQILQAKLSGKETPDLFRMAEYGFTSRPLPGADCVAVFIQGDRSNGVIIATGDQTYRLSLENDGEVALYDNQGRYVWFKKDGGLTLHDPAKITLDAPVVECTGDITAPNGNISDQVRSMADDREKYDMHVHGNVSNGPDETDPPSVIE